MAAGPPLSPLAFGASMSRNAGGCNRAAGHLPSGQKPPPARPRSQSGWSVQPVTLADRAVQGSPGPDSDHRRSAAIVVTQFRREILSGEPAGAAGATAKLVASGHRRLAA